MLIQVLPLTALTIFIFSNTAYSAEEVHVVDVTQTHMLESNNENNVAADAGQLLKNVAGTNINKNGRLTSIAQYRGMYGDRINTAIDGMAITSGGPNAMDAPLHYAPTPLISSLSIYRGIASINAAQQAIGGAIVVETRQGAFSDNDRWQSNGTLNASYSSVSSANNLSLLTAVSNNRHKVFISALTQRGDDYHYPGGKVAPSEYSRDRVELAYALQQQQQTFSLSYMDNATDDAGPLPCQ
ncbi:MAG: TonB-dependent receptor plug domain-containing protein [Pseudomonadales bacterium]|nr:TonB-dependent receptor plug domain-containing protein [Pseudomonadales bacterium]